MMKVQDIATLIETSMKKVIARLDRIEDRVLNLGGHISEAQENRIFSSMDLRKIERQMEKVVGRLAAVEDQLRAARTPPSVEDL